MARFNYLLIIVLPIVALTSALAQPGSLIVGLKGGVAISDMHFDSELLDPFFEPRTAFGGGMMLRHLTTPWLNFQTELNYVMKGAHYDLEITDEQGNFLRTSTVEFDLDYLEVPLLASLTIPTDLAIKPRLTLGPQLALNVRNRETYPGMAKVGAVGTRKNEAKDLIFDLIAGIGLDIVSGNSILMFDFRYEHGLSETGAIGANKLRALFFTLGVGVKI